MAVFDLRWEREFDAFKGRLDTNVFGVIDLIVARNDQADTPSEAQLNSAELVSALPDSLLAVLNEKLRRYAVLIPPSADGEDWSDVWRDLEASDVHLVIIPPLHSRDRTFAFLLADTPIDEEHGVAFCLRDGVVLKATHSDDAYENYEIDGVYDDIR